MTEEKMYEELRCNFAYAWRAGWLQGINIGPHDVNFNEFKEPCPTDKMFSWEASHADGFVNEYTRGEDERTSLDGCK